MQEGGIGAARKTTPCVEFPSLLYRQITQGEPGEKRVEYAPRYSANEGATFRATVPRGTSCVHSVGQPHVSNRTPKAHAWVLALDNDGSRGQASLS